MGRLFSTLLSLAAFSLLAPVAVAQSQPVAWAPGYTGSCSGCDLSGRNLAGWDLVEANYNDTVFEYAFMRGIQANRASFERIEATGADLRSANLSGAHLSGAILTSARLQALQATGADFRNALMRGTNLQGAIAIGANFGGSDLSDARLEAADLSGSNFNDAILTAAQMAGTIFNGASMSGTQMSGAHVADASFQDVRFLQADLTGLVSFETANFEGACASAETRLPDGLLLPLCEGELSFIALKATE